MMEVEPTGQRGRLANRSGKSKSPISRKRSGIEPRSVYETRIESRNDVK